MAGLLIGFHYNFYFGVHVIFWNTICDNPTATWLIDIFIYQVAVERNFKTIRVILLSLPHRILVDSYY